MKSSLTLVVRRMRWAPIAVALCLSTWNGAASQDRPNYSGVWTQAATPQGRQSGTAEDAGSGWGSRFVITQVGNSLTLERAFFTRSDIQPALKFQYALDGSETVNELFMGRGIQRLRSRAAWQGDVLVITTTYNFKHPETGRVASSDIVQRLTLEPARLPAWPPSLIVETTRAGALGGSPFTTRSVYSRN